MTSLTATKTTTIVKSMYDFSSFYVIFSNESIESVLNSEIVRKIESEETGFDGIAIINKSNRLMFNTSCNSTDEYFSQFDHLESQSLSTDNIDLNSIPFVPFI